MSMKSILMNMALISMSGTSGYNPMGRYKASTSRYKEPKYSGLQLLDLKMGMGVPHPKGHKIELIQFEFTKKEHTLKIGIHVRLTVIILKRINNNYQFFILKSKQLAIWI